MAKVKVLRPKLKPREEEQVFARVGALKSRFGRADKVRFERVVMRPRFRERFLEDAYEVYLSRGGKAGDAAEFFKWLITYVVENQDAIVQFIKAIIGLFA